MPQKLIIELTEDATEKYLAYAQGRTEAEVNEGCEPSGSNISVQIDSYESIVYAEKNGRLIEFGEAKVDLVEVD